MTNEERRIIVILVGFLMLLILVTVPIAMEHLIKENLKW